MKLSYETQGTSTFLVYDLMEHDELDTMSLGMLTNNHIPGFAAASFLQIDTTKYIKYNVSSKVSARQLFSGSVNKKRLLGVLCGVVDAMLNAEEYMLDPQMILLDLDYIFTDVTTCASELICLPILDGNAEQVSVEMFFKNILFTTQFDQTENCDHVAQLINYLNRNPILSLPDFKNLLQDLANAAKPAESQRVQQVAAQPVMRAQPAAQSVIQTRPAPQSVAAPVAPAQKAPAPVAAAAPPKSAKPLETMHLEVPKQQVQVPNAPAMNQQQTAGDEKKMSWFYLMQHYNKDNAALYKAQQEAKKNKNGGAPAPAKPQKAAPAPKQQPAAPGYAIPGQQVQINDVPVQKAAQPAVTNAGAAQYAQPAPRQQVVQQQPVQQAAPSVMPPVQSMPLNFGETTVLGGAIGETTVLGGGMPVNQTDPHLLRAKNSEKIPLNKPVFRIGKERSYVDYFISDNTAISRSHANIVNQSGEFFVEDTNSTNHTYVNGTMIPSGQKVKLAHGDKVRLANEDFEFKLY